MPRATATRAARQTAKSKPAKAGVPTTRPGRRPTRARSPAAELAKVAQDGGLTLVLGAGISLSHGVPGWTALVEQLWREAFADQPLPEGSPLWQSPAIALERISQVLGPDRFVKALRTHLYRGLRRPSRAWLRDGRDTLSVLARVLTREHALGPKRRIQRVITFNADDLLERACAALSPRSPVLKVVARASQHPERGTGTQPIPCYHLHGYLPAPGNGRWHQESPDTLVFTEAQYWRAVATPLSFANRVMSFALHDTRCIFVGLSMTDLNVLRWLALRADELTADKRSQFSAAPDESPARTTRAVRRALQRHYWIHSGGDDPGGHLASHLETRGILSVLLKSGWGSNDFAELWDSVLPG